MNMIQVYTTLSVKPFCAHKLQSYYCNVIIVMISAYIIATSNRISNVSKTGNRHKKLENNPKDYKLLLVHRQQNEQKCAKLFNNFHAYRVLPSMKEKGNPENLINIYQ